jgi:transposase
MPQSDADRRIEELEAQLAQQRRLNDHLSKQVARLLDEVAKLTKKPSRGRERRKEREAKAAGRKEDGDPPEAPPRDAEVDTGTEQGVPRREPIPDHLERHVEEHSLDSAVTCCHTPVLEERDPKVLERKTFIPARTAVKRVELHQAQCMCCGAMHTAETPPLAMPNGSMSAALIAYIVSGKCGLHLPLKRIMEVLLEKGLRMAKSTMSNVMRHASTLLIPVYDRIVAALFTGDLLHLDGTGIKALTPGEKGSHRGQIAVYCNEQLTVYAYSENKEGRHLRDFLRVGEPNGFRGNLVADAANNMDRLYRDGTIQECGCWYHARDKFDAAAPGAPLAAAEAKAWIGTLFDVDSRAERAGDTAAERLARRKRESIPLLRGFYRWMNTTQHRYPPDEELWKAIQYCRNHWRALTRFMTNGSIPMTNNLAERELGVFGRGRKNWLFAGSDAGGEWLAILHTVVRTCQRLSVAPFDYLAWALPQLSDLPVNRGKGTLAALTPMAYAVAH